MSRPQKHGGMRVSFCCMALDLSRRQQLLNNQLHRISPCSYSVLGLFSLQTRALMGRPTTYCLLVTEGSPPFILLKDYVSMDVLAEEIGMSTVDLPNNPTLNRISFFI